MAYTVKNFKTKKELKDAVKFFQEHGAGEDLAQQLGLHAFSPGPFPVMQDGRGTIEGPQAPAPHRWYAAVELRGGIVVKVTG